MTPIDQSTLKRMETITTTSSERQSKTCANYATIATVMKQPLGRNSAMKGKCNLCGTKCNDEFCGGCVYYLQKKKDRSLVTARKTVPIPYLFGIRADRSKSDFFTLQTDNHYEK